MLFVEELTRNQEHSYSTTQFLILVASAHTSWGAFLCGAVAVGAAVCSTVHHTFCLLWRLAFFLC